MPLHQFANPAVEAARGRPALVVARDLMYRFHAMIRRRNSTDLDLWISDAAPSLPGSFVRGIVQDRAGVHAVLTQPFSNGQTEGQNTKLTLVKRQMFGRAKLDLFWGRLFGATSLLTPHLYRNARVDLAPVPLDVSKHIIAMLRPLPALCASALEHVSTKGVPAA
jgi:hypothetical protein